MKRSIAPRLTRTRRRALTVPFVITLAAAGSACGGEIATVPAGDRPAEQGDVVSNPAEPEPETQEEDEVVISSPAEPEPEEVVSNPAPPEDDPTTDALIVVSNPAPPSDG